MAKVCCKDVGLVLETLKGSGQETASYIRFTSYSYSPFRLVT